jgi:alkanesulfonate monooxygenase SsuD/methylene tetrahydromethanopterin reductase-like flavin-dependent oxidoreductase (luciferase family)
MQFGLFDHIDRSEDRPLAQQFDERLELVRAADAAGFYCYHVAEHHGTPLNTIPVPGLFLSAVARATKQIRIGSMVYLLPLHSPLQIIEEIAILDHLSHGRMQPGVGRGVSPFELNFHNVDAAKSRDIFIDAYDCVMTGITSDRLTHHGPYYSYDDVPIALHPLQQPHPPFWYGSSNVEGSTWAGEHGLQYATNGPSVKAKENIDAFGAALARRRAPLEASLPEFEGGVAIGASRTIVVAESEAEALRIARAPFDHLHHNQTALRRENAKKANTALLADYVARVRTADIDEAIADGSVILGTPDQVGAAIEHQQQELGINYMLGYFMFGNMALEDGLHSLDLFAKRVMPAFTRPDRATIPVS